MIRRLLAGLWAWIAKHWLHVFVGGVATLALSWYASGCTHHDERVEVEVHAAGIDIVTCKPEQGLPRSILDPGLVQEVEVIGARPTEAPRTGPQSFQGLSLDGNRVLR